MATFQASLVNFLTTPPTVTITTTGCQSLTITDNSNYSTNTSPSSALANFSNYITITVVHLPSGTIYTMQSYPTITPDETLFQIPAPSTGQNVFTLPLITGDGAYQVTLQAVPNFDNAQASYVVGVSQVFNPTDGKIYTCIQQGAGHRPDLSPTYWTVASYIFIAYTDIQTITLDCNLNQCLINNASAYICNPQPCNNPCGDPNFVASLQLIISQFVVTYLTQSNQANLTTPIIDFTNTICSCPPVTNVSP